jgi:hypothetical protein
MDAEQIVKKEIERLKRAYNDAQDRYAYSGSRSTDNTMYKYAVLKDALEKSLAGPTDEENRLNRRIDWLRENITNATQELRRLEKEREILPGYVSRIIGLLEGRK